jgi:hypothetical protein
MVGRPAASALVLGLVAWSIAHQPPAVARDGGYSAAAGAAQRIASTIGPRSGLIVSLPEFKSPDAYLYPLTRMGAAIDSVVTDDLGLQGLVVVCDDLFVDDCGGPPEDAAAGAYKVDSPSLELADRFSAAPGRTISVYIAALP